jgi:glycosyltransferase involved in cell wall biosynthesis
MNSPTLEQLPPSPADKNGWFWTEQSEQIYNSLDCPKITIVTPNYNYGQFLEETIRSVLLQSYPNLEYIIIDGGSSDNSVEIIKKYEPWLTYWISEKDQGQSDAINKGFKQATGDIYYWINSDDILCKNALNQVVSFWQNHPDCNFLTGDGHFFNSQENEHNFIYYIEAGSYTFEQLLAYHQQYLPQPSVFFSAKVWQNIKQVKTNLCYAMDIDLWLRIIKNYPLYYLPECLSYLRLHQDSKTIGQNLLLVGELREVIINYMRQEKSINYLNYLKIIQGLNKLYALSMCRRGLLSYELGDNQNKKWLQKALIYWFPIIFSRDGIKLLLRTIMFDSSYQLMYNFYKKIYN